MVLYHLTWDDHLPSIIEDGLRPNHRPNKWLLDGAMNRSKGKLFLCRRSRRKYWEWIYLDGWVDPPRSESRLVWIAVDVDGLKLTEDFAAGENYEGDFWTRRRISPKRLKPSRKRF